MAQLPGTFDANKVDTGDSFSVIPPGDYVVQIVQSEMRATKSGDGQYVWLELDVVEGQHTGRKLWDRVNILNPNPQAQQIGEKILAQICKATGELSASDSDQFHFKPMVAKVKVQPAKGEWDESNQIKSYRSKDGVQTSPTAAAAVAPAATQENSGSMPWE